MSGATVMSGVLTSICRADVCKPHNGWSTAVPVSATSASSSSSTSAQPRSARVSGTARASGQSATQTVVLGDSQGGGPELCGDILHKQRRLFRPCVRRDKSGGGIGFDPTATHASAIGGLADRFVPLIVRRRRYLALPAVVVVMVFVNAGTGSSKMLLDNAIAS